MNQSLSTIAIKGGYGLGNFGDDALMVAAYEITKRVFETQFIVFLCRDASYIRRIIPSAKVVSPNSVYNRIVADIILYGGGTQFYAFPLTKARRIPSVGRVVRNLKNPALLVQKIRRKILQGNIYPGASPTMAAIGIGLGPFVENCHHLHRVNKLFTRMEFVAVRDIDSYDLCKKWGCRNLSLRSDLCYLPDLWKACLPKFSINTTGNIKKIGVIIRDWPHTREGNTYAVPLFQVITELRRGGRKVEFISFAERKDGEWITHLKDKHECVTAWNPERDSISSFLELLSGYDVFITARYHGAVFASIFGKPSVCIGIEQKLSLVSGLLSDGARLWTYPFNASECLKHVAELERNYSKSVKCLARVVERQGALVSKMVDEYELFIIGKRRELESTHTRK